MPVAHCTSGSMMMAAILQVLLRHAALLLQTRQDAELAGVLRQLATQPLTKGRRCANVMVNQRVFVAAREHAQELVAHEREGPCRQDWTDKMGF